MRDFAEARPRGWSGHSWAGGGPEEGFGGGLAWAIPTCTGHPGTGQLLCWVEEPQKGVSTRGLSSYLLRDLG